MTETEELKAYRLYRGGIPTSTVVVLEPVVAELSNYYMSGSIPTLEWFVETVESTQMKLFN